MINFLPKIHNETGLNRNRYIIYAVTTGAIVLLVVAGAGILGTNFFQVSRGNKLNQDIDYLTREIDKLSVREAYIRQIDLRTKSIEKFKSQRGQAKSQLADIKPMAVGITLDSWDYKMGKISLTASTSAELENYTDGLKTKFTDIKLDNIQEKGGVWISSLTLKPK